MKKTVLPFLILFYLLPLYAYTQKQDIPVGDPNDLDFRFVPDKSSILNSSHSSAFGSSESSNVSLKNVFKFNLLLVGRSVAAFSWEHPFGKIVSLEGSMGLCYGQDILQKTFSAASSGFSQTQSSQYVGLNTLLTNSTFAGSPNLFLSGGPKFYFSDDAPKGSYFQLNIRYYSNGLNLTSSDVQIIGSSNYSVRNLSLNFIYGYQIVSGSSSKAHLVQDLNIGFGFIHTSYNGVTTGTNTSNYGTFSYWMQDGTRQSFSAPVFVFSYCLGFGL